MKTQAMLVRAYGGPEVLEPAEVDVPAPGAGEVLLRHLGIGVNFVDVYYRSGQFGKDSPPLPAIVGVQGAGIVADSVPAAEHRECLAKLAALEAAIDLAEKEYV